MRILLFAHLKDAVGQQQIELQTGRVNSDSLWRKLITAHPELEPFRGSVRLAKNFEYAGSETIFDDVDEVALIPPVSGG